MSTMNICARQPLPPLDGLRGHDDLKQLADDPPSASAALDRAQALLRRALEEVSEAIELVEEVRRRAFAAPFRTNYFYECVIEMKSTRPELLDALRPSLKRKVERDVAEYERQKRQAAEIERWIKS